MNWVRLYSIMLLESIRHDTAYALRAMHQNPAFAATAVLVLALSIGGNAAMFTVIRTVLLKPLDYRDPDRLVEVSGGATPVRFEEMRGGAHSFTGLGAFGGQESLKLTASPPAATPESTPWPLSDCGEDCRNRAVTAKERCLSQSLRRYGNLFDWRIS